MRQCANRKLLLPSKRSSVPAIYLGGLPGIKSGRYRERLPDQRGQLACAQLRPAVGKTQAPSGTQVGRPPNWHPWVP